MSTRQGFSERERQELLRRVHQEDVERARRLLDPCIAVARAEWVPMGALVDALRQIEAELTHPSSAHQTYDA